MADGDAATIDVDDRGVNLQVLHACKRLVDLDDADVVNGQLGARGCFSSGGDWPDAQDFRVDTHDGEGADAR